MSTTQVKSNLAKLLATENLTVEHRKVATASFNVETRVLYLPIWDEISNNVYDLLVGHEVGHAVYTPREFNSDNTGVLGGLNGVYNPSWNSNYMVINQIVENNGILYIVNPYNELYGKIIG